MENWPFVGRDSELEKLRRWLRRSDSGGVVLVAAAGVGKTRVAQNARRLAEEMGFETAWVTATRSASTLPLGAFGALLPLETLELGDRAALLGRSATAIVDRASDRRLVLVVDDAHLLDDASATLLHQLAISERTFIVATIRLGEPVPDPVVALWKDDLLERIDLRELSDEVVGEIVVDALGAPVDHAAVAAVVARANGNPLFARELVVGALEHGVIRHENGIWLLAGKLAPSHRLAELVRSRLGELDTEERWLVDVLACAESIGSAELAAVLSSSDTDGASPSHVPVVERLERADLVTVTRDLRRRVVQLAHPLYGDVVRRELPASTEQRIAQLLAEVVESHSSRRRGDVLRVGALRLMCGGADRDLMLAAATKARWLYALPLAEKLTNVAVALGAGFDAELLAAQLAGLQGRNDEAELRLEALAGVARGDEQRTRVALARLDNAVHAGHGEDVAVACCMAEEVEASLDDPGWRDEVTARRARLSALMGYRAASDIATQLVARATGRPLVDASLTVAYCLGHLGRTAEAVAAAERGYAAQIELDEPFDWNPSLHLDLRNLALDYAGYLVEAERSGLEQHAIAVRNGDRQGQAFFARALTQQVAVRGNVRTAIGYGREAVALYREAGRTGFVQYSLLRLALALALARELDELQQAMDELDSMGPVPVNLAADNPQTRAWAAVATGDLAGARAQLRAGVGPAMDAGDLVGASALLHGLARLGRAGEVRDRLADLAGTLEGPLPPARALHADALVAQDGERLEEASSRFADMGAVLLAAEASADAAVAWHRAHDGRRAAGAQRQAAALAARCEGASTPALQRIEARAELTPAERETALLAARGTSNREIAETLHLSVRTVENRLQRVYGALGIRSRDDLGEALGVDDPA